MKIKKVYNKRIFEGFFMQLKEEYENDNHIQITDSRVNEEMGELLNKESEMLCLKGKVGIIGYCVYRDMQDKQISIRDFLIRKEFRGNGYGKKFLGLVEEFFQRLGLNFVFLASRPGKEGFYISCGYTGQGLLQVDTNKATKYQVERFFNNEQVKIEKYKLWNNEVHQFGFDANVVFNNPQFLDECDKNGYYAQVLFSKELVKSNNVMVN